MLSLNLRNIEVADLQPNMLQHISLDFLIGNFALGCGQIQLVQIQRYLDVLLVLSLDKSTTVSTCLEWAKKMSHPTGIPLAEDHNSETVSWIGYFSLIWCLLLRYNPSNCKQ